MADSNFPEDGRGESNVFIIDGRGRGQTLSSRSYEVFVTATLSLWVGVIYLFVYRAQFNLDLGESDLAVAGTVSSGLAGLALTFLGLVHQLNPREKYLKLGLGLLTFFLLLSTVLTVMAAAFYAKDFVFKPSMSVWFFWSSILLLPYFVKLISNRSWSWLDYILYLAPLPDSLPGARLRHPGCPLHILGVSPSPGRHGPDGAHAGLRLQCLRQEGCSVRGGRIC
jgi:hypothetical protein